MSAFVLQNKAVLKKKIFKWLILNNKCILLIKICAFTSIYGALHKVQTMAYILLRKMYAATAGHHFKDNYLKRHSA